jgi:hypothetical protein
MPALNLIVAVAAIVIAVIALTIVPTSAPREITTPSVAAPAPALQNSPALVDGVHAHARIGPSPVTVPVVDCGGERPVTMC